MHKLLPSRLLLQTVSAVPICTNCHPNIFCTRQWVLCLYAQTVTTNVFCTRRWVLCLYVQTVNPTSSVPDDKCCAYMYKLPHPTSYMYKLLQPTSSVPDGECCAYMYKLSQPPIYPLPHISFHSLCIFFQSVTFLNRPCTPYSLLWWMVGVGGGAGEHTLLFENGRIQFGWTITHTHIPHTQSGRAINMRNVIFVSSLTFLWVILGCMTST